ncbi:type II toxin-antitoxin system VapC family toxin [Pelodictyon phaeoclathratiforme]|uniref:PilT protein domain protein n=1 Tax=Pelodictyon phaeoclathratiforme (strain DSM 5477 / BU-1) TaxID=324925 RepID=B4SDH2_PELPB|nr:type II toxin-antitoxin system VapC family toxin [Pelodictyon phaeoclathratiforme]ACF42911.1 PilT protein domain protein [Pelodictyon phaeoclathratiforme BU-1]
MIVLDTHIWVKWIIDGNPALSEKIVNAMRVDCHWTVSAISCFEVSLLVKRGKLQLLLPVEDWIKEVLENSGIDSLPVTCDIMHKAAMLSEIHRDPADRIIIAAALVYDAKLASIDSVFPDYMELQGRLFGK